VKNLKPFLDMIAYSEIGPALLARSDDGYNVLVGGKLFSGYADHPREKVDLGHGLFSTAAGRYQILERYFDAYRDRLGLKDFTPAAQDAIAGQMVKERGALLALEAGDFATAVSRCKNIWASLPGANYHQHENNFTDLRTAYVAAGGTLDEVNA
jgi:muramidase (phage lysozyme)